MTCLDGGLELDKGCDVPWELCSGLCSSNRAVTSGGEAARIEGWR